MQSFLGPPQLWKRPNEPHAPHVVLPATDLQLHNATIARADYLTVLEVGL